MVRTRFILASLVMVGCADPGDYAATTTAERAQLAASVGPGERPRGIYVDIPERFRGDDFIDAASAPTPIAAAGAARIIYMNRSGGTYTPGNNDARTNRTSIAQATSTIPPWNVSEAGWQQVMTCVKGQFARYNVDITDVDPGNVPHFESVVAGQPGNLNNPDIEDAGGVSPWDPQNCGTIENSIVFTFAPLYGTDYQTICEVVAQEVSHSFGLDHEYLCSDPMTYLEPCGPKSFQDVDAQCGEFAQQGPRTCTCSSTQNSVQMLTARLGLKGDQLPTLGISFPADGEVVAPGFAVTVDATDDNGVTEVELSIDGTSIGVDNQAPFEFATPDDLAAGDHVVEVVARDASGESTSTITVTVDPNSDNTDPGNGDGGGGAGGDGSGDLGGGGEIVGGCSSTRTGGELGGLALVFGLALVLARRRR